MEDLIDDPRTTDLMPSVFGADGFSLGDVDQFPVDADHFTDLLLFDGAWGKRQGRGCSCIVLEGLDVLTSPLWYPNLVPTAPDLLGPFTSAQPRATSGPSREQYPVFEQSHFGAPTPAGLHRHSHLHHLQRPLTQRDMGTLDLVSHAMVCSKATPICDAPVRSLQHSNPRML